MGTTLLPAQAAASDFDFLAVHVSPGIVWSWAADPVKSNGNGFEISAGYTEIFSDRSFDTTWDWLTVPSVGAFYRQQSYDAGSLEFTRKSVGAQGGLTLLGVEVGYAWREGVGEHRAAEGVQLSPFVSIGILYTGPQWLIPTGAGDTEFAWNLGLKFPLPHIVLVPVSAVALAGLGNMGPGGRPLRVGAAKLVASPVSGSRWRLGRHPATDDLDASTRARLAQYWLGAALAEHASVPAFERLAVELAAARAPAVLVTRARRAAREEVRHARLCFTLASAYADSELDPGPLPPKSFERACPSLEALAIESLHDGCVAEGIAAAQARAAGSRARDRAVRAALRIIARDEASHAALAWSIVTHCLERDDGVRRALARELEGLERQREENRRLRVTSTDDAGIESRHGELTVARQHLIAARVIDRAVARLAKALWRVRLNARKSARLRLRAARAHDSTHLETQRCFVVLSFGGIQVGTGAGPRGSDLRLDARTA